MKISVFQALTILMEKYYLVEPYYTKIRSLYLSGMKNARDEALLQLLLRDKALHSYRITADKAVINSDPVRRYFESHLSCQTLIHTLDLLDIRALDFHFETLFNLLPEENSDDILETFLDGKCENKEDFIRYGEFTEAIRLLKKPGSYPFLKPNLDEQASASGRLIQQREWELRKTKLLIVIKCVLTSLIVLHRNPTNAFPIDIYFKADSVFSKEKRGKKWRLDPITKTHQDVYSGTLGIMRSYMPLACNDVLLATEPAEFQRPADRSDYRTGSYFVSDNIFATVVTPFVNSISGVFFGS